MKHLSSLLSILVLFLIPFTSIGQAYTVTVAEHAVDIVEGHTTYRLYVDMVNPEDKLSSISGGGDTPLILTTTDGFYNDDFGGTVASAINPAFYSFFPTLLGDSWITIGIESQPEGDQAAVSIVEGATPLAAHFDATSPLSGTDILIDDSTGSAWYTLSDASNGLPDSETMRTMFMQLSIPTGGEICATVNVQIFGMGLGSMKFLPPILFVVRVHFSQFLMKLFLDARTHLLAIMTPRRRRMMVHVNTLHALAVQMQRHAIMTQMRSTTMVHVNTPVVV